MDLSLLEDIEQCRQVAQKLLPSATVVVGGGCLRDMMLSRPIKDVDIFVKNPAFITSPDLLPMYVSPWLREYGRPDLHGVWDYVGKEETQYPIQVILADYEGPMDLARTFDLGLSRVVWDGKNMIITDDFLKDAEDKAFRIRRGENEMEIIRTMKRIERLQQKYPEYTLRYDL